MINGFIEIYDWQYDDIDAVWCGYCPCGYQIWRAEGLPVDEDEIKESIRCMDCGQLGCVACATLNDAAEWLCFDCYEYLIVMSTEESTNHEVRITNCESRMFCPLCSSTTATNRALTRPTDKHTNLGTFF